MTIPLGILSSAVSGVLPAGTEFAYIGGRIFDQGAAAQVVTIPNVSLGPDAPDRQIIVAIMLATSSTAGDIQSVTVGGVPFTIDGKTIVNRNVVGIARGVVSGTSADIVVTAGTSTNTAYSSSALAVYSLSTDYVPASGVADNGLAARTLPVPVGAVGVVAQTHLSSQSSPFAAPVTTDYNENGSRLAGSLEGVSGGVSLVSSTSGTTSYNQIVGVSYAVPVVPDGSTITDTFSRPNWAFGLGVSDSGHAWEQWGTGVVGISNGAAYRVSNFGWAMVDFGQADMLITQKVVVTGSYFAGIYAGYSDPDNGYSMDTQSSGTSLRFYRAIDGVVAALGGGWNSAFVAGDTIGMSVEHLPGETLLTAYVNGSPIGTFSDTTAGRPAGTYAGIQPYNNGNIRIDDFTVEAL